MSFVKRYANIDIFGLYVILESVIKMKILCIILSFFMGFFTYPISYLTTDKSFDAEVGCLTEETLTVNGEDVAVSLNTSLNEDGSVTVTDGFTVEIGKILNSWFNYYAIVYSSDSYIKGEFTYRAGVKVKTEEFFLEPGENVEFYSFIDNCMKGTKANSIEKLSFTPLNTDKAEFTLKGISVFNRSIPDEEIYIEGENLKIGVNMLWGGALSYLEDTNSNVQAVKYGDTVKVDSNASERYGAKSVNNHVNLINRNDTGRLVQQSYYGTSTNESYEGAYYGENLWNYNPVQGGNQYNENSKIVDVRIDDNLIYIKCQPLDWAKSKEYITPSYMEAYYTLENSMLHVSCRFIDFSGYEPATCTQEIPAFYCIEPLNNYVYYGGDEPWTDGELTYEKDLIFWPDAGYPNFTSSENWSAFTGEFDDSFGIGLFVPNEDTFLTGVYSRGNTSKKDPSVDSPTSYIAVVKNMEFRSFAPFEYDYYIATGNVNEIRNTFSALK